MLPVCLSVYAEQINCLSVIALKRLALNFLEIVNEEKRDVTMSSLCILFYFFLFLPTLSFSYCLLFRLRMRIGCQCRLLSVFYHLIKHAGAAGLQPSLSISISFYTFISLFSFPPSFWAPIMQCFHFWLDFLISLNNVSVKIGPGFYPDTRNVDFNVTQIN